MDLETSGAWEGLIKAIKKNTKALNRIADALEGPDGNVGAMADMSIRLADAVMAASERYLDLT